MSYCTGKHIEKSRGLAMKMLIIKKKKSVGIVADRFGVNYHRIHLSISYGTPAEMLQRL